MTENRWHALLASFEASDKSPQAREYHEQIRLQMLSEAKEELRQEEENEQKLKRNLDKVDDINAYQGLFRLAFFSGSFLIGWKLGRAIFGPKGKK